MRRSAWVFFSLFTAAYLGISGYFAYTECAPYFVKKRVTITLQPQGQAQFVFSAVQANHEIVYDMKTIWAPQLEATPQNFIGETVDTPFRQFLKQKIPPLILKYVGIAILPFCALGGWFLGLHFLRTRTQRRLTHPSN